MVAMNSEFLFKMASLTAENIPQNTRRLVRAPFLVLDAGDALQVPGGVSLELASMIHFYY